VTRVVVDTNVWVAGLLSRTLPPARIVDLCLSAALTPVVSPEILSEYEHALLRRELTLSASDVKVVIDYLKTPGSHIVHVEADRDVRICTDPDDDKFLCAAVAGQAAAVITGNLRHYPQSPWRGIVITSPTEFLKSLSFTE